MMMATLLTWVCAQGGCIEAAVLSLHSILWHSNKQLTLKRFWVCWLVFAYLQDPEDNIVFQSVCVRLPVNGANTHIYTMMMIIMMCSSEVVQKAHFTLALRNQQSHHMLNTHNDTDHTFGHHIALLPSGQRYGSWKWRRANPLFLYKRFVFCGIPQLNKLSASSDNLVCWDVWIPQRFAIFKTKNCKSFILS